MSGVVIPYPDASWDLYSVVEFVWRIGFETKWNERVDAAQELLEEEVLRHCEPYIPLKTGFLIQSGSAGGGNVSWSAPYASYQYYSPRVPGSQRGALRGPYWFARMKAIEGPVIIAEVKKVGGGII